MPRRLALGLLIALVLVGGGLGVAVAAGWLLHDSARPASISAAVARLRSSGAKGAVYVYATRGSESVDAFVSARHVYPTRTAITVVPVACGSRVRWDALEGRSNVWTLCRGPELRGEVESHRFFGQSDRTTYACTGAQLTQDGSFECRSAHGRETGTVRVVGREAGVLHVRTVGRVVGGDSGTETTDWWFGADGLPVRIQFTSKTSRPLRVGRAHYSESADLRLVSTSPSR